MDNRNLLEFEKTLVDIENRIRDLENASATHGMDLSAQINELREQYKREAVRIYSNLNPWERVRVARHKDRPTTSDYVGLIANEFIELHGDRAFRDDAAILTGFAKIEDERVMLVGHRKGRNTRERMLCNWGCAHPEGFRKALAKMFIAERFNLPIVTLIDTQGAYPGVGAEERGVAQAIAENILAMSTLKVPIISIVIGEGGSGGALGIGLADRLCILEHAYYSVISPEGCAAILWKSADKKSEAAIALKITANNLLKMGIADEIIPEPIGGAHRDHRQMASTLKSAIVRNIKELKTIPPDQLLTSRYDKYRKIGVFGKNPS
ncbi:MAG TPA: acetyl-CoA carboxylase carboxyltransferase subunit alpha [Planctomycetota bacterium]|nr:acetyl-CoA carboxylase carboxyltransferase subunit alpha [Planctomycetota bacterium]